MTDRIGSWMQTFTGGVFYPLDPRPEEVNIIDIAHALSMQCRYGGHCRRFYSVAEHCIHVSNLAPDHLKLTGLLHDGSEAYLSDMVRPVKKSMPEYLEIEGRLEGVIADKFGLIYPYPPEIKRLDNCILIDERIQNMAQPPMAWDAYEQTEPLGVTLQFWSPEEARLRYQNAFWEYSRGQP